MGTFVFIILLICSLFTLYIMSATDNTNAMHTDTNTAS